MRQAVLSVFTGCAMLCAATIGMPAAAEAQTVIIINGNQPYYPQPYPYPHRHVVYDVPGYYYGAENGYYNGYNNRYYNSYGNGYYPAYRYGYNRPYWGW